MGKKTPFRQHGEIGLSPLLIKHFCVWYSGGIINCQFGYQVVLMVSLSSNFQLSDL